MAENTNPTPASSTSATPSSAPASPNPRGQQFSAFSDIDAAITSNDRDRPDKPAKADITDKKSPESTDQHLESHDDRTTDKPDKPAVQTSAKPVTDPAAATDTMLTMQPKQLRNALKEANRKLAEAEAKLKSAPQQPDQNETKVLTERLTAAEERAAKLEEQLKFTNYEKTDEFNQKFGKPFERAWNRIIKTISELPQTNPDGSVRRGTNQDLAALMQMERPEARRAAKEWFGDEDYQDVMKYRDDLLQMRLEADAAVEEWRKNGEARSAEEKAKAVQEQQKAAAAQKQASELWQKNILALDEKYPKWFKPIEGDDEGNKMLETGTALANQLFSDHSTWPMEKRVAFHAAVHRKVAGFDRLALQNHRLTKRVSELEEELKQYSSSEPGVGDHRPRAGGGAKTVRDRVFGEIDRMTGGGRI